MSYKYSEVKLIELINKLREVEAILLQILMSGKVEFDLTFYLTMRN